MPENRTRRGESIMGKDSPQYQSEPAYFALYLFSKIVNEIKFIIHAINLIMLIDILI